MILRIALLDLTSSGDLRASYQALKLWPTMVFHCKNLIFHPFLIYQNRCSDRKSWLVSKKSSPDMVGRNQLWWVNRTLLASENANVIHRKHQAHDGPTDQRHVHDPRARIRVRVRWNGLDDHIHVLRTRAYAACWLSVNLAAKGFFVNAVKLFKILSFSLFVQSSVIIINY